MALAAAAAAALGALAAGVLDLQALEPGRGLLLALAVTVPLAAVAPARRPAPAAMASVETAPPARPARPAGGTTRRGFIQVGAASSVAVAGLSRVMTASAAPPVPFMLTITEGDIVMEDGTPVPVTALPQVPPMPPTGFGRWAWFYRPDYHHPLDHWPDRCRSGRRSPSPRGRSRSPNRQANRQSSPRH